MRFTTRRVAGARSGLDTAGLTFAAATLLMLCFAENSAVAQTGDPGPRAILSREDLAAALEARLSSVKDMKVAFSFGRVGGSASLGDRAIEQQHDAFCLKGEKVLMRRRWSEDANAILDRDRFQLEAAFNGARTMAYYPAQGDAVLTTGRMEELRGANAGFYLLNMVVPRPENKGFSSENLLSHLKWKHTTVRDTLEKAGDRWCHVVDVRQEAGGPPSHTVWVDADRGVVPMRHQAFAKPGELLVEYQAERVAEAAPGIWFVVDGTFTTYFGGGSRVLRMRVDQKKNGDLEMAANTGLSDSEFDLVKRLPPGTRVFDADSEVVWTVPGEDFAAAANAAFNSMALTPAGDKPRSMRGRSPGGSDVSPFCDLPVAHGESGNWMAVECGVAGFVAVMVAIAVIVLMRRISARRRPSRA